MKITILGTGIVGQTLSARLLELGHDVTMETRNADETRNRETPNPMTQVSFKDWISDFPGLNLENYGSSTLNADLILNATNGAGTLPALKTIGTTRLSGKILIDISNPLDFSKGMPPSLFVSNTDSLAEQIQSEFPDTQVVKSLNTMNAFLMLNPTLLPGDHSVFISGNDEGAKSTVKSFLESTGWKTGNIIDLGDITTARGPEQLLPIWVRLYGVLGTPEFNFNIVRKG